MRATSILLKTVRQFTIVALLLPFASFLTAQTGDSPEINRLLEQAKAHATLADDDGTALDSYTRSKMAWQSHANRLNQIKVHANNLIKDFNALSELRDQGTPWQQEAIDRVGPLLQEMSAHLTATIQHLNENSNRIHFPEYRDYVHANSELLSKAHQMISDFVDYGEAKSKADSLEQKLSIAEPESPGM